MQTINDTRFGLFGNRFVVTTLVVMMTKVITTNLFLDDH